MTEETKIEQTATEEKKAARKAYFYEGHKVSLKQYAELMERDARVVEALLEMERSRRQRALRRLGAFMDVTPVPPVEGRTDAWLAAFLEAHAELDDQVGE